MIIFYYILYVLYDILYVQTYVFLGQVTSFHIRQDKEIASQSENAWKRYWSTKEDFKGNLPRTLKWKSMSCVFFPSWATVYQLVFSQTYKV